MKKSSLIQMIKIISSNFIGNFGSQVFSFGVGLFILKETGSALSFGLTILISPIVSLILTPFIGYLVDNFNRKWIVLLAQFCSTLSMLILFILFNFSNLNLYAEIITLLIILSICEKSLSVAFTSSIRSLVSDKDIQKTNSYLQVSSSLSMILAPVLGSVLFALQNFSTFILTIMLTEACSLILNIFINFKFNKITVNDKEKEKGVKKESIWCSFRSSIQYIKGKPLIIFVISIASFVNLFITSVFVGLPYVNIHIFQMNNIQYGFVEAGIAVGIFLAGIILGMKEDSKDPIRNLQMGIVGISMLIILLSVPFFTHLSNTWITIYYTLINVLIGSIATVINVPIMVILHKTIDEQFKGRVFSIFLTSVQVFNPLGILIFGILFEKISPTIIFIAVGCGILLIINLLNLSLLKSKRSTLLEKGTV
ncbi:hypothetical protein B4102_3836 [Heyndrickxia sporothermodurans]|uniref:Major facilitator superfamily (MFS) profile domain-containing protein n=1 Tax=Heyndrickxia sporothermodurans TaxID=46224 RepID=A0A150KKG9_9BACI|nr:MFS transporter [Heyndrickxia sporothermodurans]KYC90328.1 hypothetical protein B4102_3836 [Heyndrickxia sporothermodurans]